MYNSKKQKKKEEIVSDSEDNELQEILNQNSTKISNSRKTTSKINTSTKEISLISNQESTSQMKTQKEDEGTFVEYVLGDFHNYSQLKTFDKMTSLSLISQNITNLKEVFDNIPNKEQIKFLCFNENVISTLKGISQFTNLENLQINFNKLTKIEDEILNLNKLKILWLSENEIETFENVPETISELNLARNNISDLPDDISKYKELIFLNLAGNLILDFQTIFKLEKIPNLKKLYLSDVNYGECPVCQILNYRVLMIKSLPKLEILDNYIITSDESKELETNINKKYIFIKNKVRHNYKIAKMLFQLLKTNKVFMENMKLHLSSFFSQRKKMLEFAKYEKNILKTENETNDEELNKEIEMSVEKLKICLKLIECGETGFKNIKEEISNLNNFAIVTYFYEMESFGNFKIDPGNLNLKWTKSCIDLIKSRMPISFYEKNNIKSFNIRQIYKILNKKTKILFDSLYDNMIDEIGKFGDEKKYFDFLFMILPKNKCNLYSLFSLIYDDYTIDEGECMSNHDLILTDNLSDFDSYLLSQNINTKFTIIICKCGMFDNIKCVKKTNIIYNTYEDIQEAFNSINSEQPIVQIQLNENFNYYKYNVKGFVVPEYIIEYEYMINSNQNESNIEKIENNNSEYISSFGIKILLTQEYESIFNSAFKNLINTKQNIYINNEKLNKYSAVKFGDFSELDNSIYFFLKNSIIAYILKCFKYQNLAEFEKEIGIINDKQNEITNLKFKKDIIEFILDPVYQQDLYSVIDSIDEINLFNCNLDDNKFEEFLIKVVEDSKTNEKIKTLRFNIKKLYASKNNLTYLSINLIVSTFPNLTEIDFSHNNIENVTTIDDLSLTININTIDITFNKINDIEQILLIFKQCKNLNKLIFYANPLSKESMKVISNIYKENYTKDDINNIITKYNENKNNVNEELIISTKTEINNKAIKNFDTLFDSYSLGEQYHNFSNSLYFKETEIKESTYKSLNLSKRKLIYIPKVNNSKEIEILYLNINKIKKISNLDQFNNIIEIHLQTNKIKHIENLPITLKKLDLSNNNLDCLEGISKAENLEILNVENNVLTNIQEVNTLKKLIEFYCSGNYLTDIKECYQLRQISNLQIIDISSNEVCRTTPDIRLGMIYYCKKLIIFNRIHIDNIERSKANEYFNGKLTTEILEKKLGADYNLQTITDLDLSSLKLKGDLGMFTKEVYPKLVKLNISKNLFKNFEIFGSLPSLIELNLNYNLITTIFPRNQKRINNGKGIYSLKNLESLELAGNSIDNISGINCLKSLKILVLRENNLTKIDGINKMNNLTFLDLSFNKLRAIDKTNVGQLPELQILLCDNNFLKNINGFEKLSNLQTLSFENNKIFDYSAFDKLSSLANLKDFNISNNPFTKTNNYRAKVIKMFEHLTKLDGIEILDEEREMVHVEMQMGEDFTDDSNNNYYNIPYQNPSYYQRQYGLNSQINKNLNEKSIKKVNLVQLNLVNNFPCSSVNGYNMSSNFINLPKIRPTSMAINYKENEKPKKKFISNHQKSRARIIGSQEGIRKPAFGNKELYGFSLQNENKFGNKK